MPAAVSGPAGTLRLEVSDDELARRRAAWQPPAAVQRHGYTALFQRHVNQADESGDFDFLVNGGADAGAGDSLRTGRVKSSVIPSEAEGTRQRAGTDDLGRSLGFARDDRL